MAKSKMWKVTFNFERINRLGNKVASERFYQIWANNPSSAITEARKLFKDNEPTATKIKVVAE